MFLSNLYSTHDGKHNPQHSFRHQHTLTMLFLLYLPHCTGGSNPSVQWSISHALNNSLSERIDLFRIVRSKSSRDRGTVIHPSFKFELSHHFGSIRLGSTLRHLIPTNIWFVQVVYKVDSQLDQEISLSLRMIRVVKPVVKVGLRPKPKHSVGSILYPVGLLPFFHDDCSEGDARQNKTSLPHQISLGQWRRIRGGLSSYSSTILVPGFCAPRLWSHNDLSVSLRRALWQFRSVGTSTTGSSQSLTLTWVRIRTNALEICRSRMLLVSGLRGRMLLISGLRGRSSWRRRGQRRKRLTRGNRNQRVIVCSPWVCHRSGRRIVCSPWVCHRSRLRRGRCHGIKPHGTRARRNRRSKWGSWRSLRQSPL